MNKLNTLEELIGKKIFSLKEDFKVSINSKEATPNSVFFAINKGNDYAKEAESMGAFVIYDKKELDIHNGHYVEDSVKFMQEFARRYRKNNKFIVIGITGSNGKTTVKDILHSVLSNKGVRVYKTQGNYNNHIGLPFTILSAKDSDEILLLEMGMSNLGEIDLLGYIAKPDYSIITNIGQSHLEYLKTMENVFKAKTEIIPHTSKKVVVNGKDEFLSKLDGVIKVETKDIKTNLLGDHNLLNVSIVDSLLKYMGFDDLCYENIELTDGRFQIVKGKYTYINDAYNASPISMKASLETFSKICNESFKIIALGDMLELGSDEKKYHEDLSYVLRETNFDRLFLYGKRMKYLYEKLCNLDDISFKFEYFDNKKDIKKAIDNIETIKEKVVLLKGSRSMKMEDIMEVNN
ncbi:UDP-N-acetylmuramoyl-tripeptide--D-alanyl-D-alanine ligase [Streptobacillus moniliformis]|uniref:UDP-N-acetylmuramoyl-tripeptide--D-alanyl-D- alanine ligase n=1 Tax=Streptobacillus moniliformis TaxID=34105 RepID=UPI0007E3443C|nr:UDP-N-acetylmuramoyl-tripeptide--D-alanyl-D-alanine ligase [Streptobacillus moniliformis]